MPLFIVPSGYLHATAAGRVLETDTVTLKALFRSLLALLQRQERGTKAQRQLE